MDQTAVTLFGRSRLFAGLVALADVSNVADGECLERISGILRAR